MHVTARAYREPGSSLWTVDVTGDGVEEVTQARHTGEIDTMARSVVSLMLEVPADSVTVSTVIEPDAT